MNNQDWRKDWAADIYKVSEIGLPSTVQYGVRGDILLAASAELKRLERDGTRLDWQQEHDEIEFNVDYDFDEGEVTWVAYRVTGGVNDREWIGIARGKTLRDVIDEAMEKSNG